MVIFSGVIQRTSALLAVGALAAALVGTPLVGGSPVALGANEDPIGAPSTFHPLTPPVRILDTRVGNGLGGKLLANTPATFSVAGRAGSGIPPNANAVTGNVTVVNQSASWGIYLGPNPVAFPGSSSINFAAGQITGNGLTVALSATGTLSATYMANPGNTTDLVLDLTGFFTSDTTGATYHAITPIRMLDTRSGNGLPGRLTSNTSATFSIAGRPGSGIPPNAVAITGNLTVVNPTNSWVVYLGPVATDTPGTSNINFLRGEIKGNSLTVALASDGSLSTTYVSSGGNTTDLVLDVTGYYTPDATGASFVPINPTRLLDTRVANGLPGKLTSNTAATFNVGGRGGIPTTAAAVTGNVTVVNETDSWAAYAGPDPIASPGTSNLNFLRGDIKGNGVTVALGSGGTLSTTYISHPGENTDLVLDITGYFTETAGWPQRWAFDLFDQRAPRYQNPDLVACASAAALSMLNTIAYRGTDPTLTWQPTTSYSAMETVLAYERANMTMLVSQPGTDPHGWRNALNYYGWGSMTAGVYRDSTFATFEDAAKATVLAIARYHKPVGILARYGNHAQLVTGYEVVGDDPRSGSSNFTIVGIDLTDPWQAAGHRDAWITYAAWSSGESWVRFSAYTQNDSPYTDPIDGHVGYAEWYGKWVIIDPTR